MSYCRWGDNSDVYVFHHHDGFIQVYGLPDENGKFDTLTSSEFYTYGEAADALRRARDEQGIKVPQGAIDALLYDEEHEPPPSSPYWK